MVAGLAVACFFMTLLAKGNSLSCIVCNDLVETSCKGDLRLCDNSSDTCTTAVVKSEIGGKKSSLTARACGKSSFCVKTASMSTKKLSIKYSIGCCASDGCTPDVQPLPPPNNSPNGLTCEACLSDSASSCDTSDTIACTGEEKKCIRYTTQKKGEGSSSGTLRGCATQSFCDIGRLSTSADVTVDLACTDSSIRLERGVFLPAVCALFLLKTVF